MLSVKLRTCDDLVECRDLVEEVRLAITSSPFFTPPTVYTEINSFSSAIEKFTTCRLYCNFFEAGKILSLDEVQPCTDEEYLGGCIGMGHELLEYCVGRAAEADLSTIRYCHTLVTQLSDELNQFEFRNSPLRRKYDSLKYIVKKLTDMIYELGLALDLYSCRNTEKDVGDDGDCSSPRKRTKIDSTGGNASATDGDSLSTIELVPKALFADIRARMDSFDKQREELIKTTRDAQKLAKQGIYAVHRDMGKPQPTFTEPAGKFKAGHEILRGLFLKIVQFLPALRQGSFSAAIEELLEGELVLHWCRQRKLLSKLECEDLLNVDSARAISVDEKSTTPTSSCRIELTNGEYFGALSDLTGELGRIAVFRAMRRDVQCVLDILETDTAIAQLLVRVNTSGGISKKVDAVLANRKKVMELHYDMACLTLSGGVRGSTISAGDGPDGAGKSSNTNEED